jgi:hypothetical protein
MRLLYAAESCANLHIPCAETGNRAHRTRGSQNQRFGQVATVIPHAFVSLQGVSVTPHCRALHTPAYNMRQQGTGPVVGALRAKVWAGCYCNTTGIRAPWICAWLCTTASWLCTTATHHAPAGHVICKGALCPASCCDTTCIEHSRCPAFATLSIVRMDRHWDRTGF